MYAATLKNPHPTNVQSLLRTAISDKGDYATNSGNEERSPARHFSAFHQRMQFFGLLHWPDFTDQGPNFATCNELKRFDHLDVGDITTAEKFVVAL